MAIVTTKRQCKNLPEQQSYLRGVQYDREKKKLNNPSGKNQYTEVGGHFCPQPKTAEKLAAQHKQKDQNDPTAQKLAQQHKVATPTIKRDAQYARAVNAVDKAAGNGAKSALLSRETKVSKQDAVKLGAIANNWQIARMVQVSTIFLLMRVSLILLVKPLPIFDTRIKTHSLRHRSNLMRTLLNISTDLERLTELLDGCGDDLEQQQLVTQWLDNIGEERDRKLDNYAALIGELTARAEVRKAEAHRLTALAQADENRAKILKERLKWFFETHNLKKVDTPRYRVSLVKNSTPPLILDSDVTPSRKCQNWDLDLASRRDFW